MEWESTESWLNPASGCALLIATAFWLAYVRRTPRENDEAKKPPSESFPTKQPRSNTSVPSSCSLADASEVAYQLGQGAVNMSEASSALNKAEEYLRLCDSKANPLGNRLRNRLCKEIMDSDGLESLSHIEKEHSDRATQEQARQLKERIVTMLYG